MKKITSLFSLLLLFLLSTPIFSQSIGIDSSTTNLMSLPDTINLNDNFNHTITIRNYSSTPLTGNIYLMAAVDTGVIVSIDTVGSVSVNNFGLNDTVSITYSETYNFPNSYRLGGNIVVVWPIANFGSTHDSLYKEVFIRNPSNIVDYSNSSDEFLLYPNPFNERINIKSMSENDIKQVRIFNINGTLIIDEKSITQLDMSNVKSGIYFIELLLSNDKKTHYKMVKE